MVGNNFGGFGGLLKNPPKLVPAKFDIIFEPPKLIPAKFILSLKLTVANSDKDSEWEDSSEDFGLNAFDLIMHEQLE